MNSRSQTILRTMLWLVLGLSAVACQDTIPNRATINPNKSVGKNIETPCTELQNKIDLVDETGKVIGFECEDKPIPRPSDAIQFKSDFCACKDGKAVSYGNCISFCSGKGTNAAEVLFASFDVTADISLSGFGNVQGWCKINLEDATANANCVIEAKDEEGSIRNIEVTGFPTGNSITADIGLLSYDKTYVMTLVEVASGARSKSAQIIKFSADTPLSVLGPLKNAPISQYSCIIRDFSTDSSTQDIFYTGAYRMHFYFLPRIPPNPVPAGTTNIFCHDINLLGSIDDELFPRLETKPGIFNLWDSSDPRFFDNNANGNLDVNDLIVQKTQNFGGSINASTNFFAKFTWPGSPTINTSAGNSNSTSPTQPIGYYMAPWIDQNNGFKSFCLTSANYNSNNALYKAMRDIIGVDTEGLYIGEKSAETVINQQTGQPTTGFKDYILIRESDLKSVWFYNNNGVLTAPNDNNVANVAVYFYYPLNPGSPFVKTSTQRVYRVRGASELSSSGVSSGSTNQSGAGTSYPPHDRKIGCVPKF